MNSNEKQPIKVGDIVQAIISTWDETENKTDDIFFSGIVIEIIRKGKGVVFVQFERPKKENSTSQKLFEKSS